MLPQKILLWNHNSKDDNYSVKALAFVECNLITRAGAYRAAGRPGSPGGFA